jgi:hypothetical protein
VWNVQVVDFLTKFQIIIHLFLFLITIRLIPLTQYHSIEHKVANWVDRREEINYDNIKSITGYSKDCGVNLISIFVCYLFFIPFLRMLGLGLLPSALLVFSVLIVTKPYIALGEWIQKNFALQQPTEEQIEYAVEKGEKLIEQYRSGEVVHYIKLKILLIGAMAFGVVMLYQTLLNVFGG